MTTLLLKNIMSVILQNNPKNITKNYYEIVAKR